MVSKILQKLTPVICLIFATTAGAVPTVSRDINTYVLFAYDQLTFKGANDNHPYGNITGGNIGVNYAGRSSTQWSLSFATNGKAYMSDGTQAVADSVTTDGPASNFYNLFANSVNNSANPTIRGSGPLPFTGPIISSLPALPFIPNRALTNNAGDLTVNGTTSLTAGALRDVRFNDNAVVTFGSGIFDIRSLSIGKNVTINVTDATIFQIDQTFNTNDNLKFGTNSGYNGGAEVYVGGYGVNESSTAATTFSSDAEIHMQYFGPSTWINLGGSNQLYGRYWAQQISGDFDINVTYVVPEPASLVILSLGTLCIRALRRRQ